MSGPLIIAHRGASHDAPENTLAAVRLGWAQGTDALECDVHLTRDGRLVVIHDDDTKRVSGRRHVVAESACAELQQLDVGAWKGARFAAEKIPTLDEVLAAVPPGKRIFIEVKSGAPAVAELVRCLARSPLRPAQVAIISFQLEVARAAKKALARCEVGWIVERAPQSPEFDLETALARCAEARLDCLDFDVTWPVDAAVIRLVHQAGLKVYVWTVDDAPVARRLAADGVDGITTNRPEWLRRQMRPDAMAR